MSPAHVFSVLKNGCEWTFAAASVHWGATALVRFDATIGPLHGECAFSIAEARALSHQLTLAADEAQAAMQRAQRGGEE